MGRALASEFLRCKAQEPVFAFQVQSPWQAHQNVARESLQAAIPYMHQKVAIDQREALQALPAALF
jgi:hypothetical protein